jgi:hypothetical protein
MPAYRIDMTLEVRRVPPYSVLMKLRAIPDTKVSIRGWDHGRMVVRARTEAAMLEVKACLTLEMQEPGTKVLSITIYPGRWR